MADETLVNGGNGGRAQRQKVKRNGWTKARRAAFLKALAETCNVKLSTERAGMGHTSVYAVRHRDPAFARLWDEALAIGYDRLEAMLLQRALEAVNDIDVAELIDAEAPIAGSSGATPRSTPGLARNDVQLGLSLLSQRAAKEGLRARGRKVMSSDEVDALLTKKLDALARRLDKA